MSGSTHKGQILPLVNQMVPIDKETTFHASYDYGLYGFNQGEVVKQIGPQKGLSFNGSDAYISTSDSIGLEGDPIFTVMGWIKRTGSMNGRGAWGIGLSGAGKGVSGWNNDGENIGIDTYASPTLTTGVPYPLNEWIHVAWVKNAAGALSPSNIKIYINGIEKPLTVHRSSTRVLGIEKAYFTIGRITQDYNAYHVQASLSDFSLWNRALSESEIKESINKKITGRENGLLVYWSLNEKEGPVSYDNSFNQNDGIWNGGIISTYGPTVASIIEGKFRNGVLIEPETINLYTGDKSTAGTEVSVSTNGEWEVLTSLKTGSSMGRRHYTDASQLISGDIYTCSVTVYNPMDVPIQVSQDWCDTGHFRSTINPRETRRIYVTSSRATYDNVYRFYDIDVYDINHVAWIKDVQIEHRNYPTDYILPGSSRPPGKLSYPKELINEDEGTISMWVYAKGDTAPYDYPIYTCGKDGASAFDFLIRNNESAPYVRIYEASTSNSTQLRPSTFAFNTWKHIVITWKKGDHFRCYIDGILDKESLTPIDWSGSSKNWTGFYLGSGIRGNPQIIIDELRVESRAISSEEATAWAASGLHYNYLDYSLVVD